MVFGSFKEMSSNVKDFVNFVVDLEGRHIGKTMHGGNHI
jgi:hypothetical protein